MATKTRTPRTRKKKTNVASLFGQAVPGPAEADPEIVERLEYLLARAKGGVLTGFAHAGVEANGWIDHGWVGKVNMAMLLGATARLFHRMLKRDDD